MGHKSIIREIKILKKIIVVIIILTLGYFLLGNWYTSNRKDVKSFLVYSACESGEIHNYVEEAADWETNHAVYDRIRENFQQFNIKERHLVFYGKQDNLKVAEFSIWVGQEIRRLCGSDDISEEKAQQFAWDMLLYAHHHKIGKLVD